MRLITVMCFTETPTLDNLPTYTKTEVAAHQLERALHLFLDENDYVCAITLAGACEEILGKLLGSVHSSRFMVISCLLDRAHGTANAERRAMVAHRKSASGQADG